MTCPAQCCRFACWQPTCLHATPDYQPCSHCYDVTVCSRAVVEQCTSVMCTLCNRGSSAAIYDAYHSLALPLYSHHHPHRHRHHRRPRHRHHPLRCVQCAIALVACAQHHCMVLITPAKHFACVQNAGHNWTVQKQETFAYKLVLSGCLTCSDATK